VTKSKTMKDVMPDKINKVVIKNNTREHSACLYHWPQVPICKWNAVALGRWKPLFHLIL